MEIPTYHKTFCLNISGKDRVISHKIVYDSEKSTNVETFYQDDIEITEQEYNNLYYEWSND